MAEKRTRDSVWDTALKMTLIRGEVARPEEVAEMADVSERTVREVLNIMADCNWLKRETLQDGSVRFKKPAHVDIDHDFLGGVPEV